MQGNKIIIVFFSSLFTGYILVVSITCGGAVLFITVIVAVRCLKAIQNRASSSSSSLALPIPLLSEEEQSNFNSNLDHSVPVSIRNIFLIVKISKI